MPTVTLNKNSLLKEIQETNLDDEEVGNLFFNFGIELDEVTSEKKEFIKEKGNNFNQLEIEALSDETTYKIEVPANRYDLLCLEGLSRGLRVFLQKESYPVYKSCLNDLKPLQCFVDESVSTVRPYAVCVILRDVTFTAENLKGFMQLQEKLHQNICRERTLVSMGAHDLDKICFPVHYKAVSPSKINFIALDQKKKMNVAELFDFYKNSGNKLRKYLHIIEKSSIYPIMMDSQERIMSLPPIVNSDFSKITLDTRNVFIECTAVDFTKAKIVSDILICMFSQHCRSPFTYEPVEVNYPNGDSYLHSLPYKEKKVLYILVSIEYINKNLGTNLDSKIIIKMLNKMGLESTSILNDVSIIIPPHRPDVLHNCDIIEDVAIAFGYQNLPKEIPQINTIGVQLPINKISNLLRLECAMYGFTEVLTLSLISHKEYFQFLSKIDDNTVAVKIANPSTTMFEIVRPSLIPGILKTVNANKYQPKPIQIFEISDVVIKDSHAEVGAINNRHLCLIYCGLHSSLEMILGLLERIMALLKVTKVSSGDSKGYFLQNSEEEMFLPKRRAYVFYNQKKIGSIGIIHPNVLSAYEITNPCALLELNIQPFSNYSNFTD